jgi:DNA-3-methyladenine glycosylase
MSKIISRELLRKSAVIVAEKLLGSFVYKVENGRTLVGRIVETEAYTHDDAACHASRGMTKRNKEMFSDAGISYVYFTYGMHHCFNVVTNCEGLGEAVLVRALEPVEGIETMFERRLKAKKDIDLLSGPGKICQAFALTTAESGIDMLTSEEFYLVGADKKKSDTIITSSRVGITQNVDVQWRFYFDQNPYVSKGKPSGV